MKLICLVSFRLSWHPGSLLSSVSAGLAVFSSAPFPCRPPPAFPSASFCLENGNVECVWCNLNPDQHLGSV